MSNYNGKVIAPFIVGTKNPKKYNIGDNFITMRKASLEGLIKIGKVELILKNKK